MADVTSSIRHAIPTDHKLVPLRVFISFFSVTEATVLQLTTTVSPEISAYWSLLGLTPVTLLNTVAKYTSNSIMDLSMGEMMLRTSNGWLRLSLQLEQCGNLVEGV